MERVLYFVLSLVTLVTTSATKLPTTVKPTSYENKSVTNDHDHESGILSGDESILSLVRECNSTFKISPVYLEALNNTGKFPEEGNNTSSKCYIKCLLEKIGVMDLNDDIAVQNTKQILHDDTKYRDTDSMIDNCVSDRNEKNECDRAYEFVSCLLTEDIKRYGHPIVRK